MNCTDCDNYQRGKGRPACLKCAKYKDILIQSVKRQTIAIDVIPDTILNDIPDQRAVTILDAIRQLPLELSTMLLMYHVLDANQREIAQHLQISQQQVSKKINFALDIIRKLTIFDQF
jgi:DNA-directed RNA polymerase specialized sigma24 family protein